jgi:hypothetical protein
MADQIQASASTNDGAIFSVDTINSVNWPYSKIAFGPDNTANIVGSTSSNPFPVALSDTDNAVLDAIAASVAGTLTVGLPSGAATSALQTTGNTALSAIQAAVEGTLTVGGTVTANLSATDNAVLDAIAASVAGTLTVDGSGVTQPVSALSLPLPSGAATAANQSTANTALSAIQTAVEGTLTVDLGANNDVTLATLPDTAAGDLAAINSAVSGTLTVLQAGTVSSNNSTSTPLSGGATFTGTADDLTNYGSIVLFIDSDVDSAANGISFEYSTDGTNWDKQETHTFSAASAPFTHTMIPEAKYFRVVYTNGAGAQTHFRMQVLFHTTSLGPKSERIDATIDDSDIAVLGRSILVANNGSGYVNIGATTGGNLKTSIQEISDGLDVGAGNAGAETQRVSISTDDVNLSAIKTAVETIDNAISGSEMQVDVITSALPTGAATAANQSTANTALSAIQTAVEGTLTVDLGANNDVTLATLPDTAAGDLAAINAAVSGTLTVGSHAVTNAGTFAVQEDGAALTALQLIDNIVLAEDAAHQTGDAGVMALAVRQDTQSDFGVDGDYVPLSINADGELRVTTGAAGGGTQYSEDAAHTTGDTGTMSLAVRNDTLASLCDTDGDYTPLQVNASGALFIQEGSALDVSAATVTVNATSLDIRALTNSDVVTAELSAVDNAVLDSIDTATTGILADTAAMDTNLATVAGAVSGTEMQVDVVSSALPSGAATAANQSTANSALSAIQTAVELLDNTVSGSELQVDIVSSALPSGAATAANQSTANTALSAIQTAVELLDNAVSGSELQVDVVGALPTGSNTIGDVTVSQITAQASGGCSYFYDNDLDETAVAVKAGAGTFYGGYVMNTTASPLYLQLFNTAQGSVTVGTTTPVMQFFVPTAGDTNGSGFALPVPPCGVEFTTAITAACSTNSEGNSAPGANACQVNFFYE